MLPVATAVRTARIEVDTKTWIDVAIDGDAARAQKICELAVDDALEIGQVVPSTKLVRPCAAESLPALFARPGSVLFVQGRRIDERHFMLDLIARGIELSGGEAASGSTTTFTRMTRERCARALDETRIAVEESHRGAETEWRKFVDGQLVDARRDETRDCIPARNCAKVDKRELLTCELVAESRTRACTEARERVAELEQKLTGPPRTRELPDLRCVDE